MTMRIIKFMSLVIFVFLVLYFYFQVSPISESEKLSAEIHQKSISFQTNKNLPPVEQALESEPDNFPAASSVVKETEDASDARLEEKQLFHKQLIDLVECENIEKLISSGELKQHEDDMLLGGASNGEILELSEHIEKIRARCNRIDPSHVGKTGHDFLMESFLSGNADGLYYMATMVLPQDFDNYSEEQKREFRNHIGDLLMEEVRKCEKMALNIYGHGVGNGSHWTVDATESKSDLASYQKQLALYAYRGTLGSNEKTNNGFLELAANLDQNDRKIAQKFTERIMRSCMKKSEASTKN